jgi:hypothetical protein
MTSAADGLLLTFFISSEPSPMLLLCFTSYEADATELD